MPGSYNRLTARSLDAGQLSWRGNSEATWHESTSQIRRDPLHGVIVDGKAVTHNLVDINLGIRAGKICQDRPLGNSVDQLHPWNQTTIPRPQKRNFDDKYTWVMSPRWYHEGEQGGGSKYLALDTGGGPLARFWSTALAGMVDIGYIKATGHSVKIYLPKTSLKPEMELEWKIPKWSNTIERNRARTYFQAYAAAAALYFAEKALAELHAGNTKTWTDFKVPDEASCRITW